jgi:hypothetical protein
MSLGLVSQPARDENVTAYLSHTVVVLLLSRVAFNLINLRWGLPLVLAAAALAIYAFNRGGERPYRWWSVMFLPALGLVLMAVDFPVAVSQWLAIAIGGVWLFAQGASTLFCYVRRNPRPVAIRGLPA